MIYLFDIGDKNKNERYYILYTDFKYVDIEAREQKGYGIYIANELLLAERGKADKPTNVDDFIPKCIQI